MTDDDTDWNDKDDERRPRAENDRPTEGRGSGDDEVFEIGGRGGRDDVFAREEVGASERRDDDGGRERPAEPRREDGGARDAGGGGERTDRGDRGEQGRRRDDQRRDRRDRRGGRRDRERDRDRRPGSGGGSSGASGGGAPNGGGSSGGGSNSGGGGGDRDRDRGGRRPEGRRRDEPRNDGGRGERGDRGDRGERRPDGRQERRDERRRDEPRREDPRRDEPRDEERGGEDLERREAASPPTERPFGDGDGGEAPRSPVVRDVTRAGRHEPTADELMPPEDDARRPAEPEEEPEGKSWELLDSEFGGDDRGGGGGGGERGRRRRDRFERGRREVDDLGAGASGIDVLDAPRDDQARRPRGVEPGLTLRDLIPFLRPPRHVVVAGCGTGSGHARIAHALSETLRGAERNLVLRETDLLDLLAPEYRPAYVRSALDELSRRPALYGRPFETGTPSLGDQLPADLDAFLLECFGDKLRQALVEKRPDVVVLTHWLPLRKLEAEAAAGAAMPKIVVVAGEPDFHRCWWSPIVKSWLVASPEFERRLLAAGAAPGSTAVVGTPVSRAFTEDVDRDAVRRAEGLRREATTVLLRPGGVGSPERTFALCERLVASAAPMNLLVVAGKNDRLKEDLEKLAPPEGSVVKAYGFTDKIHELMAVSDVVVTRATPHTAAEAAALGLPLVLLRPTPGAEERLADRLLAAGSAVVARDDEQLESELTDLVKNRRRLQGLRDRVRQGERGDAAGRASERLLRLIR